MHRLGAGGLDDLNQLVDVQVRLRGRPRPEQVRLRRAPDVLRLPVGLRVHRDRGNPELVERPHHAHGDLTTVRDEDFREHAGGDATPARIS
jgi:hypothetical protein